MSFFAKVPFPAPGGPIKMIFFFMGPIDLHLRQLHQMIYLREVHQFES